MQTITLHVSGTHCAACKIFIEDTLNKQEGVSHAQVDLVGKIVTFGYAGAAEPASLADLLTPKIIENGYRLSAERVPSKATPDGTIWYALPIGLGLLALFFFVQKSGILNFGLGGTVTPLTSLLIGLIASVSSCLAVVGGLVLSLSATVAQDEVSDRRPMALFHIGRLVSFALLGGLLGTLGGAIGISLTASALLGLVASVVMVALGLNLVGVFNRTLVALPAGTFNFFRKIEHKTIAPFILGVGTFFLPCGFTQAMQVAALSSGSFMSGFLIMTSFALGTLPMLALLSFGSASFAQSKYAPLFFKSAGVLVIGLGTFAFLAGLAGLGIINPLFNV